MRKVTQESTSIAGRSAALILFAMVIVSYGILPGNAQEPTPVPTDESGSIQGVEIIETSKSIHKMGVKESAPVIPSATGGPDQYGYTWDDSEIFVWENIVNVNNDIGLNLEDDFAGPIPIGFPFKFYENTYTELFVSTNGLITFGGGSTVYNNRPIPFVGEPQPFIAPFWDDLALGQGGQGKVYVANPDANRLVIAWHDIALFGFPNDQLTFEAILHNDGKICFQYLSAVGNPANLNSATVGIEDPDGVDGLTYLYNAPGILSLVNSNALCFNPPSTLDWRVKMLPLNQGAFTNNGRSEFEVVVLNIGDLGSDTIELEPQLPPGSNWTIRLFDESTSSLLGNTNGIPTVDTGPLAQNTPFTMTVQLIAPAGAPIGSYLNADLTAKSSNNLNEQWTVGLDSAVPAPFTQVFLDAQPDVGLWLNWKFGQNPTILSDKIGNSIGIVPLPKTGGYMTIWENNVEGGGARDIAYRMQDDDGRNIQGINNLTINSSGSLIFDNEPSIASSADGLVGVAWIRNDVTDSDIHYSLINTFPDPLNPVIIKPEINVTNNSNVSITFADPRVAATTDGNFVLAWADIDSGTPDERDVWFHIVDPSGAVITDTVNLTNSAERNENPALVSLSNNRFLLAYTELSMNGNQINYVVKDSSGNTVSASQSLNGGLGTNVTGIELPGGHIILAWTDEATNQIAYAVLDEATYAMIGGITFLNTPDGLAGNFVSITYDQDNQGILTWMDEDLDRNLYYALINSTGDQLLTPPTIFYSDGLGGTINQAGYGNAPFVGRILLYLPQVQK